MRQDPAAKAARKQRATARLKAQKAEAAASAPPSKPRYPTPDTPGEMLRFATELGWSNTRTKDGWRLTHPSGASACLHTSVSDQAAWRNLRSVLLRPIREAARNDV